ncbi:MAG: hypothetical protein R3Y11_07915 [Pseudomonadota bacterium]
MSKAKEDYTHLDFDFFSKGEDNHVYTDDLYEIVCRVIDENTTEDENGNEVRPETVWIYGCNTEEVFMSEFFDVERLLYIIKDEHDEEFGYDTNPDLPFLSKVSEEQKIELQKEIGAVLNLWAKKHDLEPPFTRITEGVEIELDVREILNIYEGENADGNACNG